MVLILEEAGEGAIRIRDAQVTDDCWTIEVVSDLHL